MYMREKAGNSQHQFTDYFIQVVREFSNHIETDIPWWL
jgi:hypothetical protein